MRPHYHFVCERCDAIIDLELPIDPSLDKRLGRAEGFLVHGHELEFHGLCPKCAQQAT
jgi:Fe2+ or Zn2+ uptake regulation protein